MSNKKWRSIFIKHFVRITRLLISQLQYQLSCHESKCCFEKKTTIQSDEKYILQFVSWKELLFLLTVSSMGFVIPEKEMNFLNNNEIWYLYDAIIFSRCSHIYLIKFNDDNLSDLCINLTPNKTSKWNLCNYFVIKQSFISGFNTL